jgi:uncharacterized protein
MPGFPDVLKTRTRPASLEPTEARFFQAIYHGDMELFRSFLEPRTMNMNMRHGDIGLTPLHIAVGRNNLEMVKVLVEAGAEFVPDYEGRMPSLIAALMEVSEELADYIYEAESRALGVQWQEDV